MEPIKTHQIYDGVQELYRFENGYPPDDDGQPTEHDEWLSYDPEC